jgi:hypothetical protein
MKTFILFPLALLAGCLTARGQLTLNAGDIFTYEFNTLTLMGQQDVGTPLGNYWVIMDTTTVQTGDTMLLEMFEGSLAEAPIANSTFTGGGSLGTCTAFDAWADQQGAIRLTMLSGSVTVDSIRLTALTPTGSDPPINRWQSAFVPVPEPSTIALLGVAVAAGFALRIRRSGRSRATKTR